MLHLPAHSITAAGRTCKLWQSIARESLVWETAATRAWGQDASEIHSAEEYAAAGVENGTFFAAVIGMRAVVTNRRIICPFSTTGAAEATRTLKEKGLWAKLGHLCVTYKPIAFGGKFKCCKGGSNGYSPNALTMHAKALSRSANTVFGSDEEDSDDDWVLNGKLHIQLHKWLDKHMRAAKEQ